MIIKPLEPGQVRKPRYFFVIMSFLFLIIALLGFIPTYQDAHAGTFTIHWFAHVHGALMTAWLLLFIAQTILAAMGLFRFHRSLGQWSVVLAALIWLSMGIASFRVLIADRPPVDNFLYDVLLVELYSMILFGLFFTWGMVTRKKSAAHKRLLFLSMVVLLQAAIDRIQWLRIGIPPFVYTDILIMPLFIYDIVVLKRIHKITWLGTLINIIAQAAVIVFWGSAAWHSFWFNLLNKFH